MPEPVLNYSAMTTSTSTDAPGVNLHDFTIEQANNILRQAWNMKGDDGGLAATQISLYEVLISHLLTRQEHRMPLRSKKDVVFAVWQVQILLKSIQP